MPSSPSVPLRVACSVAAATALLAVGTTPAWAGAPTPPPPTRATAAVDAQAGGTEKSRVVGTPALTAQQLKETATKEAAVTRAMARPAARAVGHKSVSDIKQVSQSRTYWCGPATLVSLVKADGDSISQSTAANRLGTNSSGTAWYDGGYPMEKALDHYTGSHWEYVPAKLNYSPTDRQKTDFRNHLKFNVNADWGIAGNALEVAGGPHLNKHPNKKIFHWVAIRGYDDSGATTRYADPVAGSSVSWAGPVEAYNEIKSDKITVIMGDRGYIW